MNDPHSKAPVLFLIFNRPDLTYKVFQRIKQYQPSQLFIAADGPRNNKKGEASLCKTTREVVKSVDWECQVDYLYRDTNLGCKNAVSEAISWFFNHVEYGIILEDDCAPSLSFFSYMEELLLKYKEDQKVGMVSGCHLFAQKIKPENSYYFTVFPHIWGWGTWKDRWQLFDVNLNSYETFTQEDRLGDLLQKSYSIKYWKERFNEVKSGLDTWDYSWVYSLWFHGKLCISPKMNMVSNIGFDARGTHTLDEEDPMSNLKAKDMEFPLIHPTLIEQNRVFDEIEEAIFFTPKRKSPLKQIYEWTKKGERWVRKNLLRRVKKSPN